MESKPLIVCTCDINKREILKAFMNNYFLTFIKYKIKIEYTVHINTKNIEVEKSISLISGKWKWRSFIR